MAKQFSVDWFSSNIPILQEYLQPIAGLSHIRALEIGSFEGRSTHWFLNTILTHPTSHIVCVDTFEGSPEHEGEVDTSNLHERFLANIEEYKRAHRVSVFKQTSHDFFLENAAAFQDTFDFVYIDGSHKASDVLSDAVFSFYLVKHGGFLIFDDYEWPVDLDELYKPQIAIDSFITCFRDQCKPLHVNDLCIVQRM